ERYAGQTRCRARRRRPGRRRRWERHARPLLYGLRYFHFCNREEARRNMSDRLYGLIPAAGTGARLGGETPKQYLPIGGQAMLAHAVRALLSHSDIETVFVVLTPGDERFGQIDWGGCEDRVAPLYCGGPTRR